jgi:hypothetical protein
MGARSGNLLCRRHSRSYRALYSSLLCKSISKATSRPSRLPDHRESPRDEGRTMAQVLRMAKKIRSVRLLILFPPISELVPTRRSYLPQRSWPTGGYYQLSKSWRRTSRSTCGDIFGSTTSHCCVRHHDWRSILCILPVR